MSKKQKGGFIRILLGTLAAGLLGSALTGQGVIRFLMPPHPLTNFEIHKYYQNELKLNVVYSKYNLSKITDGATKYILTSIHQ